jgi:hypothetical protein
MYLTTLLGLFVLLLAVQTVLARETFAASDGGALIQLAASRPVYFWVAE